MNAQTLYVTGQSDAFRETDAPWIMEERIAASGRSYSVKVYLPEAYTAAHMRRSDETKRLVRWTVRLSDGRCVSREGALRVRAPEVWNRVRSVVAKLRGDRREQAIADALWDALTVEEREAMIAAVDLAAYTVGRSIREASEALHADLIAEMNPLALVAVDWTARFRDLYATAVFGGPVNSPAWHAMTWPQWVAYTYALLGQTAPDAWARSLIRRPNAPSTRSTSANPTPAVTPSSWTPRCSPPFSTTRLHCFRRAIPTRVFRS
jgi:hypothetical protein